MRPGREALLCPSCQRPNPEGARFCNGCGGPLSGICPSCHHVNPAEAAFCNACGSSLGGSAAEPPAQDPRAYTPSHLAERILHSRSALEGERKHVTVLFCDLADSTRIAERLGADTMHEIMDRCFALILDQVHRYEGTVNQFLGDGVMALFGAPRALRLESIRPTFSPLIWTSVATGKDRFQHGIHDVVQTTLPGGVKLPRSMDRTAFLTKSAARFLHLVPAPGSPGSSRMARARSGRPPCSRRRRRRGCPCRGSSGT